MTDQAPERIWVTPRHMTPYDEGQITAGLAWLKPHGKDPTEYVRADLAVKASPIATLLPDAVARAEKAMQKYPQPNYVISKWAEESGEVTKALIHAAENRETWENLRDELVDTLAMLHRLFVEGDKVHGLPALSALEGGETPAPTRAQEREGGQ